MDKITQLTNEFIVKAQNVHGDKYDYSLIEYKNSKTKVPIFCKEHDVFMQTPDSHLRGHGCSKCRSESMKKIIYGVGINDYDGLTKKSGESIQSYNIWRQMLCRCYCKKHQEKFPTYIGCTVCDDWIYFSNFKRWFDKNYIEGYEIDKDLIKKGNRVYSPDTCCFVPKEINAIFKGYQHENNLPIGVTKKHGRYNARFSKYHKDIHLGYFDTPKEAFQSYKIAKEKYIKEVADEYYAEDKITERVREAMHRYKVEITD